MKRLSLLILTVMFALAAFPGGASAAEPQAFEPTPPTPAASLPESYPRIIVKFKPGEATTLGVAANNASRMRAWSDTYSVRAEKNPADQLAALRANPNVEWAEPDYPMQLAYTSTPNDPYFTENLGYIFNYWSPVATIYHARSWFLRGYGSVNADVVWPYLESSSTKQYGARADATAFPVAVIDTGFYMDHPDKGANIVAGKDLFESYTRATDTLVTDYDVTPRDNTLPGTDTIDASHGTCVAGEIAAAVNNGVGTASAAYDPVVRVYKVQGRWLDYDPVAYPNGVAWIFDSVVADAIVQATDDGCKVINLSLGTYFQSAYLQSAVDYAHARGVVIVAATGNDPTKSPMYPAACDKVVGVGSYNISGNDAPNPTYYRSAFTSYGTGLDILAPGAAIWGFIKPGYDADGAGSLFAPGYFFWDGTSMASPLFAGGIASLWRLAPSLSNDEIVQYALTSAHDIGPAGYDTGYGYGAFDMAAARQALVAAYPELTAPVILSRPDDLTAATSGSVSWAAVPGTNVTYDVTVDGTTHSTAGTSFSLGTLTAGKHEVRVTAKSDRNWWSATRSSTSFTFTVAVQETDPKLAYTGSWATWNNASLSGGSYKGADRDGDSVTVAFTGTSIDWLTCTNSNQGKARIFLDGEDKGLVDLYSSSLKFQQKVWSSQALDDGAHTLTIRWTGEKNLASSGTSIGADAFIVVGALTQAIAPPAPTLVQETDPKLAYTGSWATWNNASLSGGSYKGADRADGSVTVAFTGTSIDWLTCTNANQGKVRVILDGVDHGLVDLYSSSLKFQQTVWSSGVLNEGPHALTLLWTGQKNAASTGTSIGADAFMVLGSLTQATPQPLPGLIQETDPKLAYTGSWATWNNSSLSGGSYKGADREGDSVTVAFMGTSIDWITCTNSNQGKAHVFLDGVDKGLVDLYSAGLVFQKTVWSSGTLADGAHTLTVYWTGQKNAASTGSSIGADAFVISGSLTQAIAPPVLVQEAEAKLAYTGNWATWNNASLSGGSYKGADRADASVTLAFTGTSIDWITCTNANQGKARVILDGVDKGLVDLYSAGLVFQKTVWSSGALAEGAHTLTVVWSGEKNAVSTGTSIGIDSFLVTGTLTQAARFTGVPMLVEETNAKLAYTGDWVPWSNASLSGGAYKGANRTDNTLTIAFTGTSVEWITCTNSNQGKARVVLDGVDKGLVDLYSPSLTFQTVAWSSGALAEGSHTLTIRWTGQKNYSSTGYHIGVDAFLIKGALSAAVAPTDVPAPTLRVFVDAGHGGTDPGAVDGTSNDALYTQEKDINLAVALRLQQALLGAGFEVMMSRAGDTFPSLTQRVQQANGWSADIFVSIHANAATVEGARGIEVLQGSLPDEALANVVYPFLVPVSPWTDRGVKYRSDLAVLNGSLMPSIIVECGFITNNEEEALLATPAYQARLADQLFSGVASWFTDSSRY